MNKSRTILFVSLLMLFVMGVGTAAAEMVAIHGDDINMRSGPGKKYKVIWKLGEGFPLKVLKRSGKWLRVQDFEGTIGWVHKGVTSKSPHMIVKVHKKSKKRINIRSGPGTNKRIIAKAYYGVVFKRLSQKNGWVRVRHAKKLTGWVKRSLLWGF